MNIFEFALENERLGQEYYSELAQRAPTEGIKRIFQMLASEEQSHFEIIRKMQEKSPVEVVESDVLTSATDYFSSVKGEADSFSFDVDVADLYKKAKEDEARDMDFYAVKAQEVEDPQQQEIFKKLAREEKKHFVLLEGICEFVAEPSTYLENAEFFQPVE